jgi:CheY-like chemotaxis protein
VRSVLVVEPDETQRQSAVDLIAGEDVQVKSVATGADALAALNDAPVDAVILPIDLPDTKGFDLVDEIRDRPALGDLPILLLSNRQLSRKEELHLKRLSQTTALKDVRSHPRLLDDVCLFLHRPLGALPEDKRPHARRASPGRYRAGR